MARPFHLEVVTPTHKLYDEDADMVVVRTVVGDEAYLYDHIHTNAIIGQGLLNLVIDIDIKHLVSNARRPFKIFATHNIMGQCDCDDYVCPHIPGHMHRQVVCHHAVHQEISVFLNRIEYTGNRHSAAHCI